MKTLATLPAVIVLGATFFVAGPASAHIALLEPEARYNGAIGNQNKSCPCGVGQSGGLCEVETDRSDDFRSPRVTTFEPGATVTVRWDEYIGHVGRYRVAFDPDGADLEDFNDNILLDVVDPAGGDGNINEGSIWEVEVTLPDTPCNNCTLQLIQMMDGNTTDPVLDPVGRSTYYQCADIVISGAEAPDMGPGPSMDAGNPGPGPTPVDMGSSPTPGADMGTGSGGTNDGSSDDDDSGCSVAGSAPTAPFALLLGILAFRLGRRRQQ